MRSLNFRFKIIIRAGILGVTLFFFFYALMQKEWYVTSIFLAVAFLTGIIELIYFLERWNREFNTLLLSIRQHDFANVYPALTSTTREFEKAFSELVKVYQDIRIEKEIHYQFLQLLLENINVAVICFDNTGKVSAANSAAKNLLGAHAFRDIDLPDRILGNLYNEVLATNSAFREPVVVKKGNEEMRLAVTASRFRIQDNAYLLVSLQDIRHELEIQELDSWRKLIRVLTHEIMNSVTPISSLSEALCSLLKEKEKQPACAPGLTMEEMEDLRNGLATIEGRSKSLVVFVNAYKSLLKLPRPVLSVIPVNEMLEHLRQLLRPELLSGSIELVIDLRDPTLTIRADKGMLEQVLINLIRNAIEGVDRERGEAPEIICRAYTAGKITILEIQDNGKGIPEEIMPEIFVPFFTTKEKGSGIGLSLSRQIMSLHGGTITFYSKPGIKTLFRLVFP